MGAMQRRKGASGERELFSLLADHLGQAVTRNLNQTRNGGADSIDLHGFAIEVKRQEVESLAVWWRQTLDQAGDDKPILFWRRSRQPWRAMVRLCDLAPEIFPASEEGAILSLEAAFQFIREMTSFDKLYITG